MASEISAPTHIARPVQRGDSSQSDDEKPLPEPTSRTEPRSSKYAAHSSSEVNPYFSRYHVAALRFAAGESYVSRLRHLNANAVLVWVCPASVVMTNRGIPRTIGYDAPLAASNALDCASRCSAVCAIGSASLSRSESF